MTAYYSGKDAGRKILAPATKGEVRDSAERGRRHLEGQEPRRQDLQGGGRRHAQRHDRARAGRLLDRQGVLGEQGVRRGQRLRLRPADLQVRHGGGVLQPGGRRLSRRISGRGEEAQRQALQEGRRLYRQGARLGRGVRLFRRPGAHAEPHPEAGLRHRQAARRGGGRREQGRQDRPEDRDDLRAPPTTRPGSTPRSTTRATGRRICTA